ncbi:hypothetical protein CCAX7_39810 [Capsulimonas corticalis]|uniref:Uncharacterized protein n=1 Tax=Capsulimonas corticalis TaxID=2219043 RepID=A0A402D4Z9_9BACT|nr:hypothetical protein [Capsulimonas corticalis]BDI31930.1 hypothetical protein CCAX7_39810 [Capsulimonas corticalis]
MRQRRKPKRRLARALATACLLLVAAGSFDAASMPTAVREGYLQSAIGKDTSGSVAMAAGQFRSVAANLLWMKVVDHYHHQHIADGGDWSKNESLLPMLKTIIALDPHFVEAYYIMGGTILPRTGHINEGVAVLKKGIAQNPKDYELDRQMAMLLAANAHRPADALPYAQKGLENAPDDFSRNIMKKLCRTLAGQIADARQARL